MSERLECELLQKAHYINTLTFYLYARSKNRDVSALYMLDKVMTVSTF